MTKRGDAIIFCGILAPPHATPPPPPTPQYLFILMTERVGTIIFCRILAPPQCPPPHSPDATIFIYLNDREGAPLFVVEF